MDDALVDDVVRSVRHSRKYAQVSLQLIRHLAQIEVGRKRRAKEAIKEVKNRLHQVVAVYAAHRPTYDAWLAALRSVETLDERRDVCRAILETHASTRERLRILDEFYVTLMGDLPPIRSVLDIACGLNPLAIPWMPLAQDAAYHAVDALDDLSAFLQDALPLLHVKGSAQSTDVTVSVPAQQADVALVIKALPCLQQIDRSAGKRLLEGLRTPHIVVTFPVRSLSLREKGMRAHYADEFAALVDPTWRVERFDFSDELAFRITKPHPLPES